MIRVHQIIIIVLIGVFLWILFNPIKEGFEDVLPIIKDCWVINLDRSVERWKTMQTETKVLAPIPVSRWSATDGRLLTEDDYVFEKIPILMRPENASEERRDRRNGEIGCYLSHKKLMEHLQTQDVDGDAGHLILEDDVVIDPGTLKAWKDVAHNLNADWDIFFFGIFDPEMKDERGGIAKVTSIQSLHAYMVKHSSLPKILETIKIMYDPIDEIIRWNSDKLNLYAIQPFTIKQRENYYSDIREEVTNLMDPTGSPS
jgi:GR25 family glycosyltransferase involved in LPS biosynthesis